MTLFLVLPQFKLKGDFFPFLSSTLLSETEKKNIFDRTSFYTQTITLPEADVLIKTHKNVELAYERRKSCHSRKNLVCVILITS